MPETTQIIRVNEAQSVQTLPDAVRGQQVGTVTGFFGAASHRGPLLPAHGTREREYSLLTFYRNDYNTLFKSAVAGLVKRIQSTPYEIKGQPERVEFYQDIIANADFGRGWDSFLSKMILDYSRYDGGSYIELIGRGDPASQLVGNVTGFSILDSLRCMPTGDPVYPVIYMDIAGRLHLMHTSRVVRFYDMQDTDERAYGYGECALSRCIGAVSRDILVNRYVERNLDDSPPPGLAVFKNLKDQQVMNAVEKMQQEQGTDYGGIWGRVLRLYGLQTETMPEVEFVTFSTAPEKFDLDAYKTLNVKEIALGVGLDIQDMWELSGGNIGSATQSEILHQKSKGRALGRLLKGLERVINRALPVDLEFEFKYTDADEDRQEAEKAQMWSGVVLSLGDKLTADEQRQLLANQVPAIHDIITDQTGRIVRVGDSDPKTPQQLEPAKAPELPKPNPEMDVVTEEKAYTGDGVIIGLPIEPNLAASLHAATLNAGVSSENAVLPEDMHVTIIYLGDINELKYTEDQLIFAVRDYAKSVPSIRASIGGLLRFSTTEDNGTNAVVALIDSVYLSTFRDGLIDWLQQKGFDVPAPMWGYTPHITLAYIPSMSRMPDIILPNYEWEWELAWVYWGSEQKEITKQIGNTQRSFKQAFIGMVKLARMGAMPPAAVRLALRAELQAHGEQAYMDGLEAGGQTERVLTEDGTKAVATWRASQQPFIDSFTQSLFDDKVNTDEIGRRVQMWVNKSLNPIYYMGIGEADSLAMWMWIVDPQKEHCNDCLKLNGQIHSMKAYVKSGLMPQSSSLECGGYECGCRLEKTDLPARGSLQRRSGGLFNLVARLTNAARRFLRG